jgi:S-formylglutathione hydrolase FrmB
MDELSLIDGPVPVALLALGAAAALVLLVRPGRHPLVTALVAVVLAALTLIGLNWLITSVLDLLPEPLPLAVVSWSAVAVAAVVFVVGSVVRVRPRRRVVAVACGLVVLLAVGSQINGYFAEYPTLGVLLGEETEGITPFPGKPAALESAPEATPVVARFRSEPGPASQVHTATIPGTESGFTGRDAYLYLPPAYYSIAPPLLPVLVLVSGQPGGPADWVASGGLQALLDGFAQQHGGLAPVTLVVDPNGSDGANTMCMDSDIAKADTYLSVDVPKWVTEHVGVDTNHAHWTFGGWSFGGTCSLQMATRHPDLYPSFIDVAGEREPAISSDRNQTVQAAFHGDAAAFTALTPLTLLGQRKYPQVWGYMAAGGDEKVVAGWMAEIATAAGAAGMTIKTATVPDQGHSWAVPHASLVPALTWLAPRMGFAP